MQKSRCMPITRTVSLMIVLTIPRLQAQEHVIADQQAFGGLMHDLRRDVTANASWSVEEQFVKLQLDEYYKGHRDREGLDVLLSNERIGDLDDAQSAIRFIEDMRQKAIRASRDRLFDTGLPLSLAQLLSERLPRQYLTELEKALLAYARAPNGLTQETFARAVAGALRQSSTRLLQRQNLTEDDRAKLIALLKSRIPPPPPHVTTAAYSQDAPSPESTSSVDELFEAATQAPALRTLGNLKSGNLESIVCDYFNDDAKKKYAQLKDAEKEYLLQGVTQELLSRGSRTVSNLAKPTLTVEKATQVLTAVGQLQEAERSTAREVVRGAKDLNDGLEAARNVLEANWSAQFANAKIPAITQPGVPQVLAPYADQLAQTAHLANDLTRLAAGGSLSGETLGELGTLVSQNVPGAENIAKLGSGIGRILDAQTSFAGKAQALIGTLETLVPSDALKQVQSAVSGIAPILQSAGPILAIAGFASPMGVVSLLGGLSGGGLFGGGGNSDAAALAAINAKLEEIDKKLDKVIGQLDALDKKITDEHVAVMNALEGISFDVNRTRQLTATAQVQAFSSDCEDIEKVVDKGSIRLQIDDFQKCNTSLINLNKGATKPFFTAIANLQTKSIQDDALTTLRHIETAHSQAMDAARNNCLTLVLGAVSIHELDVSSGVGIGQAKRKDEQTLCQKVLSVTDMLDSGMLSFFAGLEWNAAQFSWKLGQTNAISTIWNPANLESMRYRWGNELQLLNEAIGQQSLLIGDATTYQWAQKISFETALTPDAVQALDQNEILSQNVVRFWVAKHCPSGTAASLKYAFAYYACSPNYLESLSGSDDNTRAYFGKLHFKWTASVKNNTTDANALKVGPNDTPDPCPNAAGSSDERWCVVADGLAKCTSLPTPEQFVSGELRKADTLEALVQSREKILMLLETTQIISGLKEPERLRLLKAFAIKWAVDRNRPKEPNAGSDAQPMVASAY